MRKGLFSLISLSAGVILAACGSTEDPNAQATQVAATIFADQTAVALAATPTPTTTPMPAATSTPTATETSTATPTDTPTPTPTAAEPEAEAQASDSLALAPTPTSAPSPTPTAVSIPSARIVADTANLRSGPGTAYPVVGEGRQGDTLPITGRDASATWWQVVTADGQEAWVNAELVEVTQVEDIPLVTAAPPPAPPPPSQQWVLVADSTTDYPGPIQDRKWWYLWSEGRNNFIWQDMTETPDCYRSPNEMTLTICPNRMMVDSHSRGDAALQWKAREGGTYRFEWLSNEVNGDTVLRFYKHLDFVGSQGPGDELPYSAVIENVTQWELFFWVPQYDTPYQVRVYKLQE